jgi:hypothetical protein
VSEILEKDFDLTLPDNEPIKVFLQSQRGKTKWSKIA